VLFSCKTGLSGEVKGKPMKEQKDILHDIDELHSTTSATEDKELYRVSPVQRICKFPHSKLWW